MTTPRATRKLLCVLPLFAALGACASSTLAPVVVDIRDTATKAPVVGLQVLMSTPEPFHPLRFPSDYLKSLRADAVAQVTDSAGSTTFAVPGPGPVNFTFIIPGWGLDSLCFDDLPVSESPSMWTVLPRGMTSAPATPGKANIEVRFRTPAQASAAPDDRAGQ